MSFASYLNRIYSILGFGLEQAGLEDCDDSYEELMAVDESSGLYDDIYVIHYDFKDVEHTKAIEEFQTLVDDISAAGLKTDVRAGPDKSIIILVKSPADVLGKEVHRSRVKDWLFGVTHQRPEHEPGTITKAETPTESLRSMFHLVTWSQKLGGAGITPRHGKWENVKSVFPLHDRAATKRMLVKWSRQLILKEEDLDQIRGLFGEKVAMYFAFLQTYLIALTFPSVTGFLVWLYLPGYSLLYAIITSLWCTVFLEHWKLKEVDLSLRWNVKGVGSLKVNRAQFTYDKEIVDPITGEVLHSYSHMKQVARQLLQIPFAIIALVGLGSLISVVFAIEIFISEVYDGPFKFYLEYLPTILLAISLPFINSRFESGAAALTEYENHRTEDRHEMSVTQKIFVLSSITKYLPILLTAFVYVPCGDIVVEYVESILGLAISSMRGFASTAQFTVDSSRLRNEVVALVVTEQLLGFGEELILPVLKRKATRWYGEVQARRTGTFNPNSTSTGFSGNALLDAPSRGAAEAKLPAQARNEAELEKYNVQDDIQEMVIQFGYLALFSPVWPLIPVGFLINNWIELRSDFLKICIEHQRPAPIRADSIGPWLDSLSFLNWLGSISTAAIVYLFRSGSSGSNYSGMNLYALAATIFVDEHIYLAVRYVVRVALQRIGSDTAKKTAKELYAFRKGLMDELEVKADREEKEKGSSEIKEKENEDEGLWFNDSAADSVEAGLRLIKSMGNVREVKKEA